MENKRHPSPRRDETLRARLEQLRAWVDNEAKLAKMWMYQANHIDDALEAALAVASPEPSGEREVLHTLLSDCYALLDIDAHPRLAARIDAVLQGCDHGKCSPPEPSGGAPEVVTRRDTMGDSNVNPPQQAIGDRWEDRIWRNADVSGGAPCLAGTGVLVSFVASRFAAGETIQELAKDYAVDSQTIEAAIRLMVYAKGTSLDDRRSSMRVSRVLAWRVEIEGRRR